MISYKFNFNDKEYSLDKEKFQDLLNDEENPIEGLDLEKVLTILNDNSEVEFDIQYYDDPCNECLDKKDKKAKYFKFLEYHFFAFSKNGDYVMSNISKEYENTSFNKLIKEGKVDNSYIVSIIVCHECGVFSIEIEQCDM